MNKDPPTLAGICSVVGIMKFKLVVWEGQALFVWGGHIVTDIMFAPIVVSMAPSRLEKEQMGNLLSRIRGTLIVSSPNDFDDLLENSWRQMLGHRSNVCSKTAVVTPLI